VIHVLLFLSYSAFNLSAHTLHHAILTGMRAAQRVNRDGGPGAVQAAQGALWRTQ